MLKGADIVLQCLRAEGVDLVFGYPGGAIMPLYDALEGSFREVRLRRDPECPVCGEHPTITDYIDYEGFCASPADWRAQHAPAKVSTPAD